MDKDKILDYVMNSPENTNRAVLSSMLDSMVGGSTSIFFVNIDIKTNDVTTFTATCDKTYAEISEAWTSGQLVIFKMKYQVGDNPYAIHVALAEGSQDGESGELDFLGRVYKGKFQGVPDYLFAQVSHSGVVSAYYS